MPGGEGEDFRSPEEEGGLRWRLRGRRRAVAAGEGRWRVQRDFRSKKSLLRQVRELLPVAVAVVAVVAVAEDAA